MIIGINPRYLMSNNPAPCSLLPAPYSQGDVATLLRFGITEVGRSSLIDNL